MPADEGDERLPGPPLRSLRIGDDSAKYAARRIVRDVAGELGFTPQAGEELAIVVSELVSNILKYGVRGVLELRRHDDAVRGVGILVVAEDETPSFDLATAVKDGHDATGRLDPLRFFRRGGIGAGLGAVVRLSDDVRIVPCASGGKQIRVVRHVRRPRPSRP